MTKMALNQQKQADRELDPYTVGGVVQAIGDIASWLREARKELKKKRPNHKRVHTMVYSALKDVESRVGEPLVVSFPAEVADEVAVDVDDTLAILEDAEGMAKDEEIFEESREDLVRYMAEALDNLARIALFLKEKSKRKRSSKVTGMRGRRQRTPSSVANDIYQDVQSAASDLGHSDYGYDLEGDIAADDLFEDADFILDRVGDSVPDTYRQSGKDTEFVLAVLSELDGLFNHLPAGTFDELKEDYRKKDLRGAKTISAGSASEIADDIVSAIESSAFDMGFSDDYYEKNPEFIATMVGDRISECCSRNPALALAVLDDVEQQLSDMPRGAFSRTRKFYTKALEKSRGASTMRRRRRFAKSPSDRMIELEQELAALDAAFDYEVHQVCPTLMSRVDTSESLEEYLDFIYDAGSALRSLLSTFNALEENVKEQHQLIKQSERW